MSRPKMALRGALAVVLTVGAIAGIVIVIAAAARARSAPRTEPEVASMRMLAVPAGSVTLDESVRQVPAFELDELEVSAGDYDKCVRAGACVLYASATNHAISFGSGEPLNDLAYRQWESRWCVGGRPDRASSPMNCVDWQSAARYCGWVGKRLPTREEWWRGVGALHPQRAAEAHRRSELSRGAEWTSGVAGPHARQPTPELRWIAIWMNVEEEHSLKRQWQAWSDSTPSSIRSSVLGFRCAR